MKYYKLSGSPYNTMALNTTAYFRIDVERSQGWIVYKDDITGGVEINAGAYSRNSEDIYIGGYFVRRDLLEPSGEEEFLLALDVL